MAPADQIAESASDAAPAREAGGAKGAAPQKFDFEHKIFHIPECYFRYDRFEDRALFNVHIGDLQAVIDLDTLREEFNITLDSHDDKLLAMVQRGLRFVRTISPGDSIPQELLDGTASWRVEDRHIEIAKSRLSLQLVSWLSGGSGGDFDRQALEQLANDPTTKQRVLIAADKIAERLDLGAGNRQAVLDKIDLVARELAFVEALREHFEKVDMIADKLKQCSSLYRRERTMLDSVGRMQSLIQTPVKRFHQAFDDVDGQTGEILPLLANIDSQLQYIRGTRDELHFEFLDWEDLIRTWSDTPVRRDDDLEKVLRKTYHFLASRYPQAQPWTLMTKRM